MSKDENQTENFEITQEDVSADTPTLPVVEETVFEAGTYAIGSGIDNEGNIVTDTPSGVQSEIVSLDEAFPTEANTMAQAITPRVRDEEVSVFVPPVEKTTEDLLGELTNQLPNIVEEEPVRAPVQEDTKDDLKDKKAALGKIRKIVKDNDGYSIWHKQMLSAKSQEIRPASVTIKLNPNKPILGESRKIDLTQEADIKDIVGSMAVPPDTTEQTIEYIASHPSSLDQENAEIVITSLSDSQELIGSDIRFAQDALLDQNNQFQQEITLPDNNGKIHSRKVVVPKESGTLTGVMARAAIMDAVGLSSHFTVVLPHSGLVAVIAAPVVSELVDLQYILDTAKINVGRNYGGSVYGTTTWYVNDKIVDLFIRKIIRINLKDASAENIRRHLDPMDISTIAWGLGCSMYPDGFIFNRTALLDNGRPETVIGKIWLSDMAIYVNNRFSTRQKQHLIQAENYLSTDEEIESYKNNWKKKEEVLHFTREIAKREVVNKRGKKTITTYVELGQSNMEEYVKHGSSWDVYLRDSINDTLSMVSDENVRSGFLSRKIVASSLREYTHYIKKLIIKESYDYSDDEITSEIDSTESILEFLDQAALQESIRDKLIEVITEYINQSIKVIYGVPTASDYEEIHNENPISNKIVPINTVIAFFTLTAQIYRTLGIPVR